MTIKLFCDKSNPPLGALLAAGLINSSKAGRIIVEWGQKNSLVNSSSETVCETQQDLLRQLAKIFEEDNLHGISPLERTQIDHWLCYTLGPLSTKNEFSAALSNLNKILGPITFLVGNKLSIADLAVFTSIYVNKQWKSLISKNAAPNNVLRWYKFIEAQGFVKNVIGNLDPSILDAAIKNVEGNNDNDQLTAGGRAREGKFVELPGAEMGKVVVRFPPEASGYLHIGHAKAALSNQYYQVEFKGQLIMRFDDTNPAKENTHFEKVILEDVAMLGIKPDRFTYTSDYFDLMLEYCEKMLKDGTAYVDDTDPELMKQEREQRVESANRSNSMEKNFKMWEEMKRGTEYGQKCCVRAKIDMNSLNGCMRDPTIYRCKNEPHPRTGTKYKVYPTYDFACPIVDAIEGVTHTLRTMEYHDRDPQFYWFIECLGLRRPYIWEYSRLSMTNTVLSKRKLTWFVEQGLVDGWDDPRMPTVRGVLRRGMTVEGLKEFIIAQGSSRSVVFMEWDKIWAINKKVIDPIAPRYTAVDFGTNVPVHVNGVKEECLSVPKHPKNPEIGMKSVWVGPKLLIDQADAECLKEGENATFINWGNLLIKKVIRKDGKVTSVEAEPNLDNKDYKKTLKLTFLCDTKRAEFTHAFCVYFNHIISKPVLGKDEDFKKFIERDTRKDVQVLGDPELKKLKEGDIIQIQRRGFFRVDVPYGERSAFTFKEQPIILFYIPDGSAKDSPFLTLTAKQNAAKQQEVTATKSCPAASKSQENKKSEDAILTQIIDQGNIVRDLKSQKADKKKIDEEVAKLLKLKGEFKSLSGKDYKPGMTPSFTSGNSGKNSAESKENTEDFILSQIIDQGNIVRDLKSKKADKQKIDEAVGKLLKLKGEYKSVSGKDYKPGMVPNKVVNNTAESKINTRTEEIILTQIIEQGNIVRDLKSKKADKQKIEEEVGKLLKLKEEFKSVSGKDYKPGMKPSSEPKEVKSSSNASIVKVSESRDNTEDAILVQIIEQGNIVRDLKSQKADKKKIDEEVGKLLKLKGEFKNVSGKDYKPGMKPLAQNEVTDGAKASESRENANAEDSILEKIIEQGDLVRNLKSSKADKQKIDAEVGKLLKLKTEFKSVSGKDYKPGMKPTSSNNSTVSEVKSSENEGSGKIEDGLLEKIIEQGNIVRDLKSKKADKQKIDEEVGKLLKLKAEFKTVSGKDYKPGMKPTSNQSCGDATVKNHNQENKTVESKVKVSKDENKTTKKDKNSGKQQKTKDEDVKKEQKDDDRKVKKQTRLGLEAKKEEDLPNWYSQVLTKSEMIEYYDISGCYIYRPWSYAIWEEIKNWLDKEIKKLGVENCYFPIFVSKAMLEKEKKHIADFSPEVAWVTKSGDSEMSEPIAVRPTSETVMYPAYANWIQSYRDLPIKLNQWNNVVRWEFKHPQPFLRTREFLWQEGHTAYATVEEAKEEVGVILDLYAKVYTDLLAVPVIKGRKTEKEKFAGGNYTYTVEAYISASGRAIQGATSHHLGQNFSKMFELTYEDPETLEKKYVYQNSWGITTRTIGVMIMVHSDNQGLVLPPNVASVQTVIVPCGITANLSEEGRKNLHCSCTELENELKSANIKVRGDYRDNYSPGWKYNHWELKGVPIRIELGPKDIEKKQFIAVRRDTGEKLTIPLKDAVEKIQKLLKEIQDNLYFKACEDMKSHIATFKNWEDFVPNLEKKNLNLVPFCGNEECEDRIKADSTRDVGPTDSAAPSSGAKSLCIPLEQPAKIEESDKCIHPSCNKKPEFYTLFGRSY